MILKSGIKDIDNFYSNKKIIQMLYSTNQLCYNDYSILNEDNNDYDISWSLRQNLTKNLTETSDMVIANAFKFSKSKDLKDSIYLVEYSTYLGGGNVYNLTSNFSKTRQDMLLLQKMNWIDHKTRAVFFEFTLYNTNIKLFSDCKLIFEILPTGLVVPSVKFITINLWGSSREVLITTLFSFYLLLITVLMIEEIKLFKLNGMNKYFKKFWVYINWSIYICSWSSLPIYLYKLYALHDLLDNVSKNTINSFLSLSSLTQWNEILGTLLAFCSFLTTLKLIQLLRFNKNFNYLSKAIRNSSIDLISFLIVFLTLWLSFVQMFYLFYNGKTSEYASFLKSMETSFLIILGKFDLKSFIQSNYLVGTILFSVYNCSIVFVMVNFLITIISNSFSKTRNDEKVLKIHCSYFSHITDRIKGRFFEKKTTKKLNYVDVLQLFEKRTTQLIEKLNENF